jgi:hypothetical protein
MVDDAARRAGNTRTRFTTSLQLHVERARFGGANLVGTRAGGRSTGTLRWTGAASALFDDATLRIERDRLLVRTKSDSTFRDVGSASGVTLDVGRELLAHPQLLEVVDARGSERGARIVLEAPAMRLRSYATTERQGPVTMLLASVRSLRLVVQVAGGRLVTDRFALRSRVPADVDLLRPLAGRAITLVGSTRHCRG